MNLTSSTPDCSTWFLIGQVAESEPARQVTIHTLPFRVGRRSEMSLCISQQSVSKEHAELFEENGQIGVRDLQSTNGTYLNGQRISGTAMLREGDLVQFATVVFRVCRDKSGVETGTLAENADQRALTIIQLERLIHQQNEIVPYFQPIVDMQSGETTGYEVLVRSKLFGLTSPKEMFIAASQLNIEAELSRAFRRRGVDVSADLAHHANLFLNTHPVELVKDGLLESLCEIREMDPYRPLTLEIQKTAVTDMKSLQSLRGAIRELNISLAYDDFGSGQTRLAELTKVRPDYLKFERRLIRGIHRAPAEQQLFVESLVRMVAQLGILTLAQGIENEDDHETCCQMGFDLGQGFLYGKPATVSRYAKMAPTQRRTECYTC